MKGGIYCIWCDGSVYVGSSKDIKSRWRSHKAELRRGVHSNAILQRHYDKYGENSLKFCILEFIDNAEAIKDKEQIYLDMLFKTIVPEDVMNICTRVDNLVGTRWTQERKDKISKALTGRKASEETRRILSESHKGYIPTDEQRRKIGENSKGNEYSAKTHVFISPSGEKIEITNLAKFCRENNLSNSHMWSVAVGRRSHHKGWRVSGEGVDLPLDYNYHKKQYTLISPDGETVHVYGLNEFCRNNGLSQGVLSNVIAGKRAHHKGWKVLKEP